MAWTHDQMAARAARELQDGFYVNLGIGLPTLVANFVSPDIEVWLRELFERRKLPFPEANRKQAWLIPSAVSIPNGNGTAPGWWVDRPDGRVIVALPGPPREMGPMWSGWVVPRLEARGLGRPMASVTLRLTGIG